MTELVCLSCGAESEGLNVRVSRFHYPHKEGCRVQDIRPKATVAPRVAAPEAAKQETPLAEPTLETTEQVDTKSAIVKPKAKRAKRIPKKEATE